MNRVLIIGLDGLEPTLAERWMDSGDLPNLALLRAQGSFGPLASTRPPVTFPAWTTCTTGVGPGQHGIFDFTEMLPDRRAIRFVNSSHRQAPPCGTSSARQAAASASSACPAPTRPSR
jgi:predicted AlkP superfamily phosphohydrolase/phosphomutase